MIKWLFFDIGSTLIDESDCLHWRIEQLHRQSNAPNREVLLEYMQEVINSGGNAYQQTAKHFDLQPAPWPIHLETPYPEAESILNVLRDHYSLGIIANQLPGLAQRLQDYHLDSYFDLLVSSAEVGIAKPDIRIFEYALSHAGCKPEEAMMIGDRLDNDIIPAATIGMQTMWVQQGLYRRADLAHFGVRPQYICNTLTEIPEILLRGVIDP